MAAAGVVQGQGGDVEAAADQGTPLLVGLEQRLAGVDLDLQADIGLGDPLGEHLHHLVAHVSLSAGELVGGAQHGLGRGDTAEGKGSQRRGGDDRSE